MPAQRSKVAYYAIRVGRQTGIVNDWETCKKHIDGYPNAKFKRLSTMAEAQAFLDDSPSGVGPSTSTSAIAQEIKDKARATAAAADIADEQGWNVVYTDGACKGNGQNGSIAGVGVWWGDGDPRNIAERCPGEQTNNRAELIAIVRVLEAAPYSKERLLIKTDSTYARRALDEWLPNWQRNGFKTKKGDDVKNPAIIKYCAALMDLRIRRGEKLRLKYVKGHAGFEGNEGADRQANLGTLYPELPDRDWEALTKDVQKELDNLTVDKIQATSSASATPLVERNGPSHAEPQTKTPVASPLKPTPTTPAPKERFPDLSKKIKPPPITPTRATEQKAKAKSPPASAAKSSAGTSKSPTRASVQSATGIQTVQQPTAQMRVITYPSPMYSYGFGDMSQEEKDELTRCVDFDSDLENEISD